jgi:hypothetical protein
VAETARNVYLEHFFGCLQVMSDGNVVAAGGDMGYGYSWMKEGRDVVRIFYPSTMKWETLPGVKLSEFRWYPTQVSVM